MKKLFTTILIFTLTAGCNKEELSNGIIPNPNERFETGLVRDGNKTLNQIKMSQDEVLTNGTNNVTSLIISNSPLLQFTPDTIRIPVGTQIQLYSNVNSVYSGQTNIYGEWRSYNIPAAQVTRQGGLVTTYNTGVIRITYTCGVMGTNLPNYQASTRILAY